MKKRIYLLQHAYVPTWKYVGATNSTRPSGSLNMHWTNSSKGRNSKINKAMRCSRKIDWQITWLTTHVSNWQELEAKYIQEYDSFNNGLNSTVSGAWEATACFLMRRNLKPVICNNTIVFESARECAKMLGLKYKNISQVCLGEKKTHGGYTFKFYIGDTGE